MDKIFKMEEEEYYLILFQKNGKEHTPIQFEEGIGMTLGSSEDATFKYTKSSLMAPKNHSTFKLIEQEPYILVHDLSYTVLVNNEKVQEQKKLKENDIVIIEPNQLMERKFKIILKRKRKKKEEKNIDSIIQENIKLKEEVEKYEKEVEQLNKKLETEIEEKINFKEWIEKEFKLLNHKLEENEKIIQKCNEKWNDRDIKLLDEFNSLLDSTKSKMLSKYKELNEETQ